MLGQDRRQWMNGRSMRHIIGRDWPLNRVLPGCGRLVGETFYTKKLLPFTYTIKGGEMFTDRRERSITRSTFENAYKKIKSNPDKITGPKALNMYGAPYVWAVLAKVTDICRS